MGPGKSIGTFKAFLILVMTLALLLLGPACDRADDDDDDDAAPADSPSLDAARKLADTWIETWDPADLGWSWDSGILMMGVWELGQYTGEQRYSDYVADWLDSWIERGYTIAWSDHCPPGLLALRLYEQTGDERYRRVVDDVRSYIFERAQRTSDGGLNHMGFISGNQIWVDTLFMVTPFLLELGRLDTDAAAFDEAALQLRVFQSHLQDPDSGLFRHAYDDDSGELLPADPLFWGRGNGWALVAMANALDKLPEGHADRPLIEQSYDRLLAAIQPLQDSSSSRWHTVLNAPESYLETSIGALFSWGIDLGIQAGAAEPDLSAIADSALQGALDQVVTDETGDALILGTSFGTSPGDLAHYQEVLKGENVAYGIGIYILAAVQRERMTPETPLLAPRGTDETYVHPPAADALTADWGTFYVARGRFDDALETYAAALSADPSDGQAAMGTAAVLVVRAALDLLDQFNRYSSGEIGIGDLLTFIRSDCEPQLTAAGALLTLVENDPTFAWPIERLLILESGGSSALGACEFDAGEALLLHAVSELVVGAGYLGHLFPDQTSGSGEKSIGIALDHLINALDLLQQAIDSIMAEDDDQSDDVIPQNLLQLEGEFGLPGILPPTPVDELLADLGIDPSFFDDRPMPETLLKWLNIAEKLLKVVRELFP